MAVGDALRRLCEEIGWSYAVFWKAIGAADPVHLVWEDGYCGHTSCPVGSEPSEALPTEVGCSAAAADTICSLVKKVMASQVHVVGEGTVGRAAFTGHHQWIAHGTANGHGLSSEVAAEMNNQFRVGIQTIAIIPVLPRGVLQLGSTGLVMENINFVMYAKKLCSHLNNRSSLAVSASVKNASSQHGARVNMANLYTGVSSQVLDQRCHSTSGTLLQKQPLVPSKAPESSEFSTKMENPEIGSFQVPSVPASESDGQVSNGLSTGRGNQLSRSNHIRQDQKINRVSDPSANVRTQIMKNGDECDLRGIPSERASSLLVEPTADNDLFDMLGAEFHQFSRNVGADLISWSGAESQNSDRDVPESSIYLDNSALFSSLDNELHHSGIFSLTDTDQLLDAVISNVNPGGKQCPDDSASCKTSLTDIPSTTHLAPKEFKPHESSGAPSVLIKHESAQFVKQPCFFDKSEDGCLSQNNGMHKSQIRLWIESGQNMKCESASASNSKGLDTPSKANRKRSRPGESLKPRPKDRQLIQDRIKELRELVPNSAKCSIDALLEKTVKHMLFLQSVTKNADKLKDSAESKILGGENGPLWKDYFEGGATWAFDVGSQSMTCPIIVEDLDRPRQMLVEMLCEDRGIFLEIADFIRGLGLTILRGVMEMHKSKIWAHFTVEANRDVTRMEIFLSLVRLLEPNCDGSGAAENANNVNMPLGLVHQPVIPATGRIQ
ncbi:transcription factor LHW-like isoform X2 [Phragmites australis]|uniref:transcription factor LHW-like isoform X2 n=1 Tax=Phragmites australis TaxID=29695 RepID=UPI002D79AD6F|nr:transcription factor LHW-like isoform X2 [Phragmites australis]